MITDIDHILPINAINAVYNFNGDKMEFPREFAVLDNKGNITQDINILTKYGYNRKKYRNKLSVYKHTNTFAMKRKIFMEIGGYPEQDCNLGRQDNRDDTHLWNKYKRHMADGKCKRYVKGPVTYVFPDAANDPKKLFHNLDRTIPKVINGKLRA